MNSKILFWISGLILSLSVFTTAKADTIVVFDAEQTRLIGQEIYFFEDTASTLEIDEISSPPFQNNFIKHKSDVFGAPPSQSALWFKLTVQNQSKEDIWLNTGGIYSAWYINFYRPDTTGNYSTPVKTGAMRPAINKEYPSEFYWLKLADASEAQPKTFYIKIKSGVSPELPFYVGTLKSMLKQEHKMLLITYLFIGAMLIMFLYNLFLFFATRDKIYLSYIFLVFTNTFCFTFNNNFSFFGDHFWWWEKHYAWQYIGDIATVLFIVHFLNLRKSSPFSYKVYLGLLSVNLVFALMNLFGVETVKLIGSAGPITGLLILNTLGTAIYLIRKKHPNAKIFLISWLFMLVSLASFILVVNGIIPYTTFTRYMVYFGIVTEILLFSLALANRLNLMRNEKEMALLENVKLIENQNIMLENKVKERTHDLASKNKELHLALKNVNEQKQKIDRQNKKLHELGSYKEEMTNMIVHDLKNPLNAVINLASNSIVIQAGKNMLNLVQNILDVYKYTDSKMPLNKNMHALLIITDKSINDVMYSAKLKNISITNNISENIFASVDEELLVRVLVNILNNAIKFTPVNGKITIDIKANNKNELKLSITDTGAGIDADKIHLIFDKFAQAENRKLGQTASTGLGLTFCKQAIEAHGGQIGVKSKPEKGSTFWFTLTGDTKNLAEKQGAEKENNEINTDAGTELIQQISKELKQYELFQAGEIIRYLNKFENQKYSSVKDYINNVKNAVFSGNKTVFNRLINIE